MPIIIVPAAATATVNMYNAKVCGCCAWCIPKYMAIMCMIHACLARLHSLLFRTLPCAAASADEPSA